MENEPIYSIESYLPEIELSVNKEEVKEGEPVILKWRVKRAENVRLWKSTVLISFPESINWGRIGQIGEPIDFIGEREFEIKGKTAFYLFVSNNCSMNAKSAIVDVQRIREEAKAEPFICIINDADLESMEDRSYKKLISRSDGSTTPALEKSAKNIFKNLLLLPQPTGCISAYADISANPNVIFEDESSNISWFNGWGCQTIRTDRSEKTFMDAGNFGYCIGTKVKGGSVGQGIGFVCGPPKFIEKFDGKARGPSHNIIELLPPPPGCVEKTWIDVLSIPQFSGDFTTGDKAAIRMALKTIDEKLRLGCILYDGALDNKVAAFRDKHLKREDIWFNLLAELQNIKLTNFKYQTNGPAGQWNPANPNEILLSGSPAKNYILPNLILHELLHKCGFGPLLPYPKETGKDNIADQVELVVDACFP